jgi:hypothetical protein
MNYFMIGGDKREYGPADSETVRQWIREGRANGDTLLRAETEAEFKPLRSFVEFLGDLPASPSPAPPPNAGPGPQVIIVSAETPVRVRHAFARAWHLVNSHFGVICGATLLVWMALSALQFVPFIGPIFEIIFFGPLMGGLFLLFLKLIRQGEGSVSDAFSLIQGNVLSLILTSIVSAILTQLVMTCCCVIPGIYLQIAWLFGIPVVADKGLNFWAGLEVSRRVITPHWFKFLALFMVAFLPIFVFHVYFMQHMAADIWPYISQIVDLLQSGGPPNEAQIKVIVMKIGETVQGYAVWGLIRQFLLLISLPLGIGSFAFVYEDLFGGKK